MKVGDVVVLNGQYTRMTIIEIRGEIALCLWFLPDGTAEQASLPLDALYAVTWIKQ